LIAALQVLAVLVEQGKPASEVAQRFAPMPQQLRNLRYNGGAPLEDPRVQKVVQDARSNLGEQGRIVIRPSGTEPVIRVMVEAEQDEMIEQAMDSICGAITAAAE
jgi:phosphoglucosamine mutase